MTLRVTISKNGHSTGRKVLISVGPFELLYNKPYHVLQVIAVPPTFVEFLAAVSLSLGIKAKRVFNCHGGEIHDILFIRYIFIVLLDFFFSHLQFKKSK